MKNCQRNEMMMAIVVLLIVSAVYVPANAQTSEPRATKVRIDMRDIYGALFVRIAGTEEIISGALDLTTGIGTGDFEFTGGTGRFANATGHTSGVVQQNVVTGAYELTLVGNIDY